MAFKKIVNYTLAALTLLVQSALTVQAGTVQETLQVPAAQRESYSSKERDKAKSLEKIVGQQTSSGVNNDLGTREYDGPIRQQATPVEIFMVGGIGQYTSIATAAIYAVLKPGSEIWVAEGTYFEQVPIELKNNVSLKGGFSKDFTSRGLETIISGIQSTYGSGIEINGSASVDGVTVQEYEEMDASGILVYLTNGLVNDVSITNCIVRNNTNYSGAEGTVGVYVFYGTTANIKMQGNIIHDNINGKGTAIYITTEGLLQDSQTAVLDALIEGNEIYNNAYLGGSGSGIMVEIGQASQAKVQMKNNNIHHNTTGSGGGIFIAQGKQPSQATILIEDTRVAYNKALVGGGIDILDNTNTMDLTIRRVLVENNETSSWGAIALGSGTVATTRSNISIVDSIIRGNKSGSWGGGVYSKGKINLNITNTLIVNNTATGNSMQEGRGGGIYVEGDSLVNIDNATIFNNTASGGSRVHGGGVYSKATNVNINNSIVYGNNLTGGTLNFGKDIYAGGPVTAKHSNIGSVSYNDGQWLDPDGVYVEQNTTNQDPKFDNLESFVLSENSPMINTADPTTFDECSPTGIEAGVGDKGYTGIKNCRILIPDRKGDVNGDGRVGVGDSIIAQQVMAGKNPVGIRPNYKSSGADVNGDGKIGLPEVIYPLQKAVEIR